MRKTFRQRDVIAVSMTFSEVFKMKKRMIALVLCLMMLLSVSAAAQPVQETPMDQMFQRLKDALIWLSLDENEQALETIRFVFDVECGLTEETFTALCEEQLVLLDSGMVQSEVAVCWTDEMGVYHFGIPLVEPISPDIEALVLCSRDLIDFSSYYASTWSALQEAAALAEDAVWNIEYQAGTPMLFADE